MNYLFFSQNGVDNLDYFTYVTTVNNEIVLYHFIETNPMAGFRLSVQIPDIRFVASTNEKIAKLFSLTNKQYQRFQTLSKEEQQLLVENHDAVKGYVLYNRAYR